jgi:hypothetical protein
MRIRFFTILSPISGYLLLVEYLWQKMHMAVPTQERRTIALLSIANQKSASARSWFAPTRQSRLGGEPNFPSLSCE